MKRIQTLLFRDKSITIIGASLLFYSSVYFIQDNKQLLLLFFLCFIFFRITLKSWIASCTVLYLLFLPFIKGKTFFFTLIPAWVLGSDQPYTFGFNLTFSDLAFVGLLAISLRDAFSGYNRKPAARHKISEIFLFLFIAGTFVSIFFSQYQLVSLLASLRLARTILTYFIIQQLIKQKNMPKHITAILASTLLFEGTWATLQFLLQRPLGRSIEQIGSMFMYGQTAIEDSSLFRAQGTFDHPNSLGIFLSMLLVFVAIQLCTKKLNAIRKILYGFSFFFGIIGLVSSYSRANWITTFIVFLFGIMYVKRHHTLDFPHIQKRVLIIGLITAICVIAVQILPRIQHFSALPTEQGGWYYRIYLIGQAWNLIQESPLGIGLAMFPTFTANSLDGLFRPAPVHNLFIEIFAEAGIFSLIFFLLFLIFSYKNFYTIENLIKPAQPYPIKIGALFASFAFLLGANFYPFLWSSGLFEYFWLFIGIMI